MKKMYQVKRKKNFVSYILHNESNNNIKKKKAVLLKNIMFNKKEIVFFSLSGIVKIKKNNHIHKSFVFVGNISRSSIKYSVDANYPGIFIF